MPEIILKNITKRWGNFYAVDNLNLVIEDNSFVTLLGPSGCGKTTTLRMIAGLETPTSGQIIIDGETVFCSERGINIPANRRRVGFLFQNYALWPNMTVYQNISFGLKNIKELLPEYAFDVKQVDKIIEILQKPNELLQLINESYDIQGKLDTNKAQIKIIDKYDISLITTKQLMSYKVWEFTDFENDIKNLIENLKNEKEKLVERYQSKNITIDDNYQQVKDGEVITKNRKLTKEEVDIRVRRVSRTVKIGMFMDRYPNELSGGQQQRVAIARTLAPEPKVLFMDEPLSNLDAKLRLEMRSELQRLHLNTQSTFIYVTHDQLEAMTLATKICLLDNGLLQQYDEPLTIYEKPRNIFVADFVGNPSINFIEAVGKIEKDHVSLSILNDNYQIKFVPTKPINYNKWLEESIKEDEETKIIYDVEKVNKDVVFEYPIPKVDDQETLLVEKEIDDNDFVIGIRPEFIEINEKGKFEGIVYSSMPTGMETTLKIEINDFVITGVVYGNIDFKIGDVVKFDFISERIVLFSRKNQKLIAQGHIE